MENLSSFFLKIGNIVPICKEKYKNPYRETNSKKTKEKENFREVLENIINEYGK